MFKRKYRYLSFLLWLIPLSIVQAEDLITLYRQAQLTDPNVKTAHLEVDVSKTQYWQAAGTLLPQISASANLSLNQQRRIQAKANNAFKGERYTVNFTQTIIDAPKVLNLMRSDKVIEQFTQSSLEAEQLLMHDIVERYLAALSAQDDLRLTEREIIYTEKQLLQLRRLFEAQQIKITDVYEVEARLDVIKSERVDAETKLEIAKQNLSELTGQGVMTLARLREDVVFLELSGSLEQRIMQARTLNAGLRAQETALEASDYEVNMEHSRHLPVVDLQLNYYRSNTGFENSQSSVTETHVAAININLPLFSGGTTIARANEASKNREINRQKRIAILRGLEKETREAFLSTNASVKRIEAATKAVESSIKLYHAMQQGFKYHVQTMNDVLAAQHREFQARRELLSVRYNYINYWIRLKKVTGTISIASLETINQWLSEKTFVNDEAK
ncbi:MAG: TolC family outer membrane protein [Methylococcales bacterium]|nr:TolC family outer membrane protein [Methylococcales bacterium]